MSELIMSYGICHSTLAPLRAEPSHRGEMTSQILFGERFTIFEVDENTGKWFLIENQWDGYQGWIHSGHISLIDKKHFKKASKYISQNHLDKMMLDGKPFMQLPIGADLFNMKSGKMAWILNDAKFKGKKINLQKISSFKGSDIVQNAYNFLSAPYLWGGKSILGIDCSGLSQMAYRLAGMSIPRDAYQQAEMGQGVDFIELAKAGDLAFFDNEEGKIIHVGIMMDSKTIIHATESSGGVVIDSIDNGGIISKKHKKRTHHLRIIKRIIAK